MDSKKGDEQTDLFPCKLVRFEDEELPLPFGRNLDRELTEFLISFPAELSCFEDLCASNSSNTRLRPQERMSRWRNLESVRQMLLENSRLSEGSDSDDSVADLASTRPSLSILLNRRREARRRVSAMRFNFPPDRSSSSRLESPESRLMGCESKAGPVCLMGDRVVIQPRGADIDMVRYHPTGMTNPTGTLCYMNSVLQAMGALPLFAVGVALHSPDMELSLLNALRGLYGKMWYPAELDPPQRGRPILDNEAVRTFVRQNSKLFPEYLEHDVEELFLYFIDTLESETASLGLGAGDSNLVTRIFSGWTQLPGTAQREHFYSLRLAVHDDRIRSVKDAFFAHLSGKLSLEDEQHKGAESETRNESTISRRRLQSKFSVSIDGLNGNTSASEEANCPKNDCSRLDLDSCKVEDKGSVPSCLAGSSDSTSPPSAPRMIIQPPEVLCLCLDRNYIDHDKGSVVYDARPITVDDEIVISTAYLPEGAPKPLTYHLRSVISYRYHSWGSGHYVAGALLRKGLWAMCDDCTVTAAGGPARASRGDQYSKGGQSSKGGLASFMHFYVRVS